MTIDRRSFLVGAAAMMLMGRPAIPKAKPEYLVSVIAEYAGDHHVFQVIFAPINAEAIFGPGITRGHWRDVPSMSPGDTEGQSPKA